MNGGNKPLNVICMEKATNALFKEKIFKKCMYLRECLEKKLCTFLTMDLYFSISYRHAISQIPSP
jgi:hypothetical protein